MFIKNQITRKKLEAFHDGELTPHEREQIDRQIETNEQVRALYDEVCFEQLLVQQTLQEQSDVASQDIDWDTFGQQITDQMVAIQPQAGAVCTRPVESTTPTPSLWDAIQQVSTWLRRRPGLLLSGVAMCGIVMVVGMQYLDPGPDPANDTVVEKIVSSNTAQVAVLQTNVPSGQAITVIVVDEPTLDDAKKGNSTNKTTNKKHTRKKRNGKTP